LSTMKKILILCCGYPYQTDKRFGYEVWMQLEKVTLPENVTLMEVGESACMIPSFVAEQDKLIIVDYFETGADAGTIVRLKSEDVPVTVNGLTDIAKLHLMDMLGDLKVIGQYPETVFIGVVPKDIVTETQKLTLEIEKKVPEVVKLVLKEIQE
jgi:hydrogenase maturation protease